MQYQILKEKLIWNQNWDKIQDSTFLMKRLSFMKLVSNSSYNKNNIIKNCKFRIATMWYKFYFILLENLGVYPISNESFGVYQLCKLFDLISYNITL